MIRVLIISPSTAVRQALAALCQTESDIQVTYFPGCGSSIESSSQSPCIALVDGQNLAYGLSCVQHLKRNYPQTWIILLVETLTSTIIWAAARAGAVRCIRKEDSAQNLLETVRSFYEESG